MDKLTNDIEIKRKLLNQLREEVSEAEKSKIVKNSLRTTFPTVSAEIDELMCLSAEIVSNLHSIGLVCCSVELLEVFSWLG